MEAYEYYKKETGKLHYNEAAFELELTDDYIDWLERNIVKLFTTPVVGGSFSADDMEKAYNDGIETEWPNGYNFNIENYLNNKK